MQKINETHPLIIDVGKDTSSGDARNRGFKLAKGEYVIFVDGDDEIHPDYLKTMMDIFHEHPELNVVCCDFVKVFENTIQDGWREANNSRSTYDILHREEALYTLLWKKIANVPWVFLVKRQYLIDNNIGFPDYSYGEDIVYAYKIIANSDKIARSSKKLYLYIMHESSLIHSITPDTRWEKLEKSRNDVINYFKDTDPCYAKDYMSMALRDFVYNRVLLYDYPGFIQEIQKHEISNLSMLHAHDKFVYQLSVICFSISKRLFYHLAKFAAGRMKNIILVGQKLE